MQQTESKRGMVAVQGKDIRKSHTKEKADAIIAARKASGLWYASEDFEHDEDEFLILQQFFSSLNSQLPLN